MSTPAGWYPDSSGSTRYWDGAQWTAHVAPSTAPSSGTVSAAGHPQELAARQAQYQQATHPQAAQHQYAQHQYAPHQYAQHQYASQQYSAPSGNGVGVAGFVVGLVSVFLPLIFGLAAGATGLVLSIVGLSRSKYSRRARGLSIAGIILSSVGIVLLF